MKGFEQRLDAIEEDLRGRRLRERLRTSPLVIRLLPGDADPLIEAGDRPLIIDSRHSQRPEKEI